LVLAYGDRPSDGSLGLQGERHRPARGRRVPDYSYPCWRSLLPLAAGVRRPLLPNSPRGKKLRSGAVHSSVAAGELTRAFPELCLLPELQLWDMPSLRRELWWLPLERVGRLHQSVQSAPPQHPRQDLFAKKQQATAWPPMSVSFQQFQPSIHGKRRRRGISWPK